MTNKYFDIKYTIIVFILFSFLMDSGGDLGLRLVGTAVMIFLSLKNLTSSKYLNKICINYDVTILYLVMCVSFLPGLIVSLANGVAVLDGVKWFFSFYFTALILILFLDFEIESIIDATILAGVLYGLAQLILLLLLAINHELTLPIIDYFQSNAKGWIMVKETFGVAHPYIYLQATLSLVPIAVLALYRRKTITFFFLVLTLVVAQSRFGIFILFLFFCFHYLNSRVVNLALISLIYCIPLVLFLLIIYFIVIDYNPVLNIDTSGFDVRVGHLLSVANDENVLKILFGSGPDSLYFTLGIDDVVSNIEVSQLEYIRKYGIIGSIMFFPPLYLLLKNLYYYKESRLLVMSICSMFFVALSNPVMISMTFSWLLASILYSLYRNTSDANSQSNSRKDNGYL